VNLYVMFNKALPPFLIPRVVGNPTGLKALPLIEPAAMK